MRFFESKHQFPKILVGCHQQSIAFICVLKHLIVRQGGRELRYLGDLMPLLAQTIHDRAVHALVRQQVHSASGETG